VLDLGLQLYSDCAVCGERLHAIAGHERDSVYTLACGCGREHLENLPAPQLGPQTQYLEVEADILLYGGARGGGKSWAMLLDVLRYIDVPGWTGLILRRVLKDITKAGGLWSKAKRCFANTGAVFREQPYLDVTWGGDGGARLEFAHLGSRNIESFQGQEYALIGFDEATHFSMDDLMWMATCNRSTCGAPVYMRWTCNPDPDHELRAWVGPWLREDGTADRSLSGQLRYFAMSQGGKRVWADTREEASRLTGRGPDEVFSFGFVPALVEDNVILLAEDPRYVGKLAWRGAVVEAQHRRGNWLAREEKGGMLRWSWWGRVTEPLGQIVRKCRAWDKAATRPTATNPDPDYTVGVLMGWDIYGNWYVLDVVACREEPPGVDRLMGETAATDGPSVIQCIPKDPAAAGKSDVLHTSSSLRAALPGVQVVVRAPLKNKKVRAQKMSRELELGQRSKAAVLELVEVDENTFEHQPRGFVLEGAWMSRPHSDAGSAPETMGALFASQVYAFPDPEDKAKDDIIDAMSDAHAVLSDVPRRSVGSRWAALS